MITLEKQEEAIKVVDMCCCPRARKGCVYHDPNLQPRTWEQILAIARSSDEGTTLITQQGSMFCMSRSDVQDDWCRGSRITWDVMMANFNTIKVYGRIVTVHADGSATIEIE